MQSAKLGLLKTITGHYVHSMLLNLKKHIGLTYFIRETFPGNRDENR